jgi:hypothetical protein
VLRGYSAAFALFRFKTPDDAGGFAERFGGEMLPVSLR